MSRDLILDEHLSGDPGAVGQALDPGVEIPLMGEFQRAFGGDSRSGECAAQGRGDDELHGVILRAQWITVGRVLEGVMYFLAVARPDAASALIMITPEGWPVRTRAEPSPGRMSLWAIEPGMR